MKLILKQYLLGLRERGELDVILPDLLSAMGFNVFLRPGRGALQYGVDVAAVGSMPGEIEKVYLFSIKQGDLTKSSWDGESDQSLRQSLNHITDSFIPTRLSRKFRNKDIVICLCFGGDILESVRQQVIGFMNSSEKPGLSFEEWNGDKLASLIAENFLREDIIASGVRSHLRKSLSLLDDPESAFKHYSRLVAALMPGSDAKIAERLRSIRQINICLWIVYSWCRGEGNLEAAYLAAEMSVLYAWEINKFHVDINKKKDKEINSAFDSTLQTYHLICDEYFEKLEPHFDRLHAISNGTLPSNDVDVNLKLFDLIGKISLQGVWLSYKNRKKFNIDSDFEFESDVNFIGRHFAAIKNLITNNPLLSSPYKDDQGIDVMIALYFLGLDDDNRTFMDTWIYELLQRIQVAFHKHKRYPTIFRSYHELIEHPRIKTKDYQEEQSAGSILYPVIGIFSALFDFDRNYMEVQNFKERCLKHCNFQIWYPDDETEASLYTNEKIHGAVLSSIPIGKTKEEFLRSIFQECVNSNQYDSLSAVRSGYYPLVMLASRHYRIPVPLHEFREFYPNDQTTIDELT